MIEWAAISAVVGGYLKKYASERMERLASEQADGALAKVYRRFVPDKNLEKVNEIFVTRFQKELDSAIDVPTLTAKAYREALQTFLCNDYVQDALQAPLDGESELDGKRLDSIWKEVHTAGGEHLIELPEEFDWSKVARLHGRNVRNLMVTSSELRPVIAVLAAIRTADASERTATATERLAGPARAFDLTRYAEALKKAYTYLKVGSLDTDWTQYERRIPLESVYIPQSVKEALPPRDLTRDYLRVLREERRMHGLAEDEEETQRRKEEYAQLAGRALMEAVDDPTHERLVILGDPGLGKSTLLKHLILRWAERPQRPLTLLIELRKASRVAGYGSFLDYLEKGADQTCCLPRMELDQHLTDQASLVLFDGLDEVTESSRTDAVSDIVRFAADFPKARIIITTRIHGYYPGSTHPEQFRDAGFRQFTLQDFDDPEINRFADLWHRAAFQDLHERVRYESRLRRALEDSPAIHELAANPLLLTMMVILNRTQDLPRDRGRLYERCAELLLKNWDLEKFPELRDKKEARDIKDKLGPDQKMRILEQVAEAMQEERTGLAGNQIAQGRLEQIVEQELIRLGVAQPWSVAENLIWMLRERNFMLAYLGDRQYGFIHRTFLEYFCARDLKYRLEKTSAFSVDALVELFRVRWRLDEWQEVLRLLCGLIGAEHAGKCVSELLAQSGQPEGHGAVFLAAQCSREIRELGAIQEVRSQARSQLVSLSRYDLPYYCEPWKDEDREVSQVRSNAVRELARGWKDDPDTPRLLKERVSLDDSEYVRWVAVEELAMGWADDPETRRLLQERVTHDDSRSVRQAATNELVRRWKDDPEVQEFLAGLRKPLSTGV